MGGQPGAILRQERLISLQDFWCWLLKNSSRPEFPHDGVADGWGGARCVVLLVVESLECCFIGRLTGPEPPC